MPSSQEAYRVEAVIIPFTDQGPGIQRGKVNVPGHTAGMLRPESRSKAQAL